MRLVMAGAGAIGCFAGGLLAARHEICLLGRARILDPIRTDGLHLTDFAGLDLHVASDRLVLTEDPGCLAGADLVIVAVKSGATAALAAEIAAHARPETPILSFQNGLDNVETLRAALPGRDVRAGMVPFNVVPSGPAGYHRSTSGDIVIGMGDADLAAALSVPGLVVQDSPHITAVQWGKLVLNLNNAVNALSGLTLQAQLMDRDWRRVMADQMAEALLVLKSAGIDVQSTTPLPAWMGPHVLRLPTPLFTRIAARMLTIDPKARTSMAYDLAAGRTTEIDSLQGQIISLGRTHDVPTPMATRIAALVRTATGTGATDPRLSPDDLRPG